MKLAEAPKAVISLRIKLQSEEILQRQSQDGVEVRPNFHGLQT